MHQHFLFMRHTLCTIFQAPYEQKAFKIFTNFVEDIIP